jgi:acyl carrier protein
MNRQEVEREIRRMISEIMPSHPDPESLPADVPIFRDGLGLDSLSGLNLLVAVEKRFSVYIDDDNFDVLDSLNSLIDFVVTRGEGSPGGP